jgi:hypothetical protein
MASCAIVCFLTSGSAGGPQNVVAAPKYGKVGPKWRVDLRPAIGSLPLGRVVGHGHETQGRPVSSLWFLDDNRIVATFVIREGKPSLSSREALDASSALRLRAIFLDAASGQITGTLSWPTSSRFARIIATHEGRFVTQTGSGLTLYSADLTEVRKLALPATEASWTSHSSPTGKNILFLSGGLGTISPVPWVWVDADKLQVVLSWEDARTGWIGISDDKIAMTTCTWFHECEPGLRVRGLATPWKTIVPTLPTYEPRTTPRPQFVNDDRLLLLGPHAELVRTDGTVVFVEKQFSGGCWSDGVLPSAVGSRFVVPACKLKGKVSALDVGGSQLLQRIFLYDVPFDRTSFVLDVEGPAVKGLTQFAVSPDGTRLAILNDEALEVLQLPPLK